MNKNRKLIFNFSLVAVISFLGILFLLSIQPIRAEEDHKHHHAMDKHGHDMDTEDSHAGSKTNLGICPVMGGRSNETYSYEHEGETYYFCCPGCIEEFGKNPKKYISKIKEINMEAYQFGFSPELIQVKKNDIVKIDVTSRDVPHGIYIKAYNINVAIKKGETKKIEFIADKTGEFDILCSVYCGSGHHDMRAKLVVEE